MGEDAHLGPQRIAPRATPAGVHGGRVDAIEHEDHLDMAELVQSFQ
jgi:hypothetical protein